MQMEDYISPGEAPIAAALYVRIEAHRAEIRQLRLDAREQLGEDLTRQQRAVILEAETDSMWRVLDAIVEAVHTLERGRPFHSRLILE